MIRVVRQFVIDKVQEANTDIKLLIHSCLPIKDVLDSRNNFIIYLPKFQYELSKF